MQERKIDAFVNDHPVLAYEVKMHFASTLLVLPETFDPGYYVLAFPPASPLRKPADQALLEVIESPAWVGILYKYIQR